MIAFGIAVIFIILAHITKSVFLQIMAGFVTITAGVNWIANDSAAWTAVVIGSVIIATGLYELVMVGYDLIRGQ